LAITITLFWLLLIELSSARSGVGASLFGLVRWYAFGLCLLSGIFLTADSISSERREGTLGLLFLSELKGYDIVLGKFVALGVNAFYGLLALMPAAALSLLLGGVTGAQFWRTALALTNMLFCSLAVGMFVSAFARDPPTSMANTLVVLLLMAALPLLATVSNRLYPSLAWQAIELVSPFLAFLRAGDLSYAGQPKGFWAALFVSGLVGCVFLAIASAILSRSWKLGASLSQPARRHLVALSRTSTQKTQSAKRRLELLGRDPVQWLTHRQLGHQGLAWLVVAAWGAAVAAVLALSPGGAGSPLVSTYIVLPFGFLLKLVFAVQATRFFVESRQSGALDFLLCTPLSTREIVHGHAKALALAFFWPVMIFVALLFVPTSVQATRALNDGGLGRAFSVIQGAVLTVVRLAMDMFALGWFGMALALTSRRPALASARTVLLVLILPSLFSFCWLDIVTDTFFIAWAVSKLQGELRNWVTAEFRSTRIERGSALSFGGAGAPAVIVK
jgi:ABC-type transport system involved in multi-copper enzyme maturation permease subunit